jgi:hypothetical protein
MDDVIAEEHEGAGRHDRTSTGSIYQTAPAGLRTLHDRLLARVPIAKGS